MKLPVFQTTGEILEYCWAHRNEALRFAAIPVAIDLGVVLMAIALGADLETQNSPAALVIAIIGLVVYLPLSVTWYRLIVFGPEDAASRPLFTLGGLEARLLGWQIVILLLMVPLGLAGLTLIVAGLAALGPSMESPLGVSFVSVCVVAFLFTLSAISLRLSIGLAMAATGRPVSLSEAWARTMGLGTGMVGVTIMLVLATVVLMMPAMAMAGVMAAIVYLLSQPPHDLAEAILLIIVARIFGVVILLLGSTLIAFVYNRIAESMTTAGSGLVSQAGNGHQAGGHQTRKHEANPQTHATSDEEVSAAVKRLGDYLTEHPPETTEDMRTLLDGFFAQFEMPADVTIEDTDAGGVPARWVSTSDADPDKVIFYLHGGGFTAGSMNSHQRLAADVSAACGARILLLDYRLAPEHPYPAGLDDCVAAYRWLLESGIKPGHVVIMGDSAGGGLTISTALRLKDAGLDQPAALVALSPWVNLACDGETMDTKAADDPMTSREQLLVPAAAYLNGHDAKDPMVSPIYADLRGLPPLLIQVGSREVLLDDTRKLAVRANADEVKVTAEEWQGMFHVWHMMADWLTDGHRALGGVGAFVRKHMG